MPKFTKKPVTIEAVQFTEKSIGEIQDWMLLSKGAATIEWTAWMPPTLTIHTLEGDMTAQVGDWIVRGVQGEFYPCKPDIFELTYDPAPAGN